MVWTRSFGLEKGRGSCSICESARIILTHSHHQYWYRGTHCYTLSPNPSSGLVLETGVETGVSGNKHRIAPCFLLSSALSLKTRTRVESLRDRRGRWRGRFLATRLIRRYDSIMRVILQGPPDHEWQILGQRVNKDCFGGITRPPFSQAPTRHIRYKLYYDHSISRSSRL